MVQPFTQVGDVRDVAMMVPIISNQSSGGDNH